MRFLINTAVAGLMVAGLAGCGGQGSAPADSSSSAPVADTSAAAAPAATADSAAPAAAAAAGSAPAEFAQCQACHSTEAGKNLVGPSLAGVYGRKAGSIAGFGYTAAFKKLDLSWDEASLDKWLTNPAAMAPGTMMAFPGIADAARRKAVIDYLKTLK